MDKEVLPEPGRIFQISKKAVGKRRAFRYNSIRMDFSKGRQAPLQEALSLAEMHRVIVHVRGAQRDLTGEENVTEMVAEGRHYYRNGKHYVLYEDHLTDEEDKTSTVLKIGPSSLTLLRHGAVVQEQHFEPRSETCSRYETPYGAMDLAFETRHIDITYGTVSGTVDLDYALKVNGSYQSDNSLHIEITSAPGESHKLN